MDDTRKIIPRSRGHLIDAFFGVYDDQGGRKAAEFVANVASGFLDLGLGSGVCCVTALIPRRRRFSHSFNSRDAHLKDWVLAEPDSKVGNQETVDVVTQPRLMDKSFRISKDSFPSHFSQQFHCKVQTMEEKPSLQMVFSIIKCVQFFLPRPSFSTFRAASSDNGFFPLAKHKLPRSCPPAPLK
ncbi:hypothetical protein SDJN03_08020, partial [Cucurbita argyrosperma subsp. sororia]